MKESEVFNLWAGFLASRVPSYVPERPGYLAESLAPRTPRPQIEKVWCSLSTPQLGAADPEILTRSQRASVTAELRQLQQKYRLLDMPDSFIDEIASPPRGPDDCTFARTTRTISGDLTTLITPCQFGGTPDYRQCGCLASVGLAAVDHYKIIETLTAGRIFMISDRFGRAWRKLQDSLLPKPIPPPQAAPFKIL